MELPPEIWGRVFEISRYEFNRDDVKKAALVCHIFRDICQATLFRNFSLSPNIGAYYQDGGPGASGLFGGHPGSGNRELSDWEWGMWDTDMKKTVRSARRLGMTANHTILAGQMHSLQLCGYGLRWYRYPEDPFTPPDETRPITRTVFDAFLSLRQTLTRSLHDFVHLRRLELRKYPIDNELLKAIDSHPALKELEVDFCWFPVSTFSLTSITSMSFRHIPTNYGLVEDVWMAPAGSPSPYAHVPDHHITSGYELVSPETVEGLDLTFGEYGSDVRYFLDRLCSRMEKGHFQLLQKLKLDSTYFPSETPRLFSRLFARTPVLRELRITQAIPLCFALEGTLPPPHIPHLEILSCPLEWARFLVPGRPVRDLRVWVVDEDTHRDFMALTESDLDNVLRPLTLSKGPITTLHLPEYPPLAPVWLLMPYISAMLPTVRDLRISIAGEKMRARQSWKCGTRAGAPLPAIGNAHEVVEEGLLEKLVADVQEAVEVDISSGVKVELPHISERINAHRGIVEEIPDSLILELEVQKPVTSMARRNGLCAGGQPSRKRISRRSTPSSSGASTRGVSPDIRASHTDPLEPLRDDFDDLDDQGFPIRKPEMHLDVLIFLAEGYYPLPASLQSLAVNNCFESCTRGSHIKTIEDYELCLQTALEEISERHTRLSSYEFAEDGAYGPSAYRKLELHRKEDLAWFKGNRGKPRWERRGSAW
ncbi:hypothetical protein NMY22_g14812 [Coprinellus aureogranulatus]|nr:hypothetical protein NMY22_g14812 [Coprinellus aureogranulatus]